jgi:hypothetical protein
MGWHCSGVWNFALQMPNWAEHLKPGSKLNAGRQVDIASDYSFFFFLNNDCGFKIKVALTEKCYFLLLL